MNSISSFNPSPVVPEIRRGNTIPVTFALYESGNLVDASTITGVTWRCTLQGFPCSSCPTVSPTNDANPFTLQIQTNETTPPGVYFIGCTYTNQYGEQRSIDVPAFCLRDHSPMDASASVNIGPAGTIDNVIVNVDDTTGTPSCKVTLGGTPEARIITLDFSGLKGETPQITADDEGNIYVDGELLTASVAEAISQAEKATSEANTAAENATNAAQAATSAAESATTATSSANEAAGAANEAASAANTAAESANSAASEATTAAESATNASQAANEAAKEAATAAQSAETAAESANSATSNATSAAETANSAAQNANTAAESANGAAAAATSAADSANSASAAASSAAENANEAADAAQTAASTADAANESFGTSILTGVPEQPVTAAADSVTLSLNRRTRETDTGQFGGDTPLPITLPVATEATAGVMSAADKSSLDGLPQQITDAVSAETEARESADTTLQGNITAEQTRAKGQEAAIRSEFAAADTSNLQTAKQYADNAVSTHNTSGTAHTDIRELLNTCTGLPTYDQATYKLTFRTTSGQQLVVDLPIEQMDLRYNSETQSIEWDNGDGSVSSVPVSEFIKEYVGSNGAEIVVTIGEGNTIEASIVANSIAWEKLSLALQQKINDKATTTYVNEQISAETSARQQADATLQQSITAEQTRAEGQESAIRSEFAAADTATLTSAKNYADTDSVPAQANSSVGQSILTDVSPSVDVSADSATINITKRTRSTATGKFGEDTPVPIAIPAATESAAGLMSAEDKTKLDTISGGGGDAGVLVVQTPGTSTTWVMSQNAVTNELNNESTAREQADTTLQGNITAEQNRAEGQEAAIRTEFAEADASTLTAAKEYTNSEVSDEASARAAADTSNLQTAKQYADNAVSTHNTSGTAHTDIRGILSTCTGLPTYDPATYKLTFQTTGGRQLVVDLPIEQMDLRYNSETQSIEWDNGDGSVSSVPVSEFVKEYVGSNGTEIIVSIGEGNVIQASIVANSISWEKLSLALQQKIDAKADTTYVDNQSVPAQANASLGQNVITSTATPLVTAGADSVTVNLNQRTRKTATGTFGEDTPVPIALPAATEAAAGVMSAADKASLDGLPQQITDAVSAEAEAREAADTTLQQSITAEQTRAKGQEAAIRSEFAAADTANLQTAEQYADNAVSTHNTSGTAHTDIRGILSTCTGLPTYDPATYKLTFQTTGGRQLVVDLPIEQMDLRYNSETQSIEWDNGDGSVSSVPVSEFIKEYAGSNGAEIVVSIGEGNTIQASIVANSISWEKLSLALQQKINDKATTTYVNEQVSAETSARQQADATLQGNIDKKLSIDTYNADKLTFATKDEIGAINDVLDNINGEIV